MRGTEHPAATGNNPQRRTPLVGIAAAGGEPERNIGRLHQVHSGRSRVEPDIGDLNLAGEVRPRRKKQAGLQCREGDRAVGRQYMLDCFAGEPIDARRNVDGQHRRCRGRRNPGSAKSRAIRRVNHEVTERKYRGPHRGINDRDLYALVRQSTRRDAPVVAVVALAGEHHDPPPVGASHHLFSSTSYRRAGALDQHRDRHARLPVGHPHLLRSQHRNHGKRLYAPPPIEVAAEDRSEAEVESRRQRDDNGLGGDAGVSE